MEMDFNPDENLLQHYKNFGRFLSDSRKKFEAAVSENVQAKGKRDDFVWLGMIGKGSFGRVHLVRRKNNPSRILCCKVMEKMFLVEKRQVDHTKSEILFSKVLDLPFIIKLEAFFMDHVYLYLVMPFIEGGDMYIHLRKMKKFGEHISKFYGAQIILAFDYLHYLGIIYRDLKPENIILTPSGYLKLIDFGFAKRIENKRTYTLCGTPEYLAPEVILNLGYNQSVDWWTFGILMYEISAGYPPFYSKDVLRIYEKIVEGKFIYPPHFSRSLRGILQNILKLDRTQRYGNLKNGSKDIKSHDWFKYINFDDVLAGKAPAPYKPKILSEEDLLRKADRKSVISFRSTIKNEYGELFQKFI